MNFDTIDFLVFEQTRGSSSSSFFLVSGTNRQVKMKHANRETDMERNIAARPKMITR